MLRQLAHLPPATDCIMLRRSSLPPCCSPCSRARMQTPSTASSAGALHTPSALIRSGKPACFCACQFLCRLPCLLLQRRVSQGRLRASVHAHLHAGVAVARLPTCQRFLIMIRISPSTSLPAGPFFPAFATMHSSCVTVWLPLAHIMLWSCRCTLQHVPPLHAILLQTVGLTETCSAGRVHEGHPADPG